MKRFSSGTLALELVGALAIAFLTLPIAVLLIRGTMTRSWEGLPASGVPEAIALSLFTTTVSAMLTVTFGTPLAFIFARWQFRFKRLLAVLVELPIVLPPAVAGLALLITLGSRGFLGPVLDFAGINLAFTTGAVVLAQTFVSAPFYIRTAQVGFQNVPKEIENAARVDGASGWALFRFITLPLALRALAAGLTLSWARALGEFGATILFAGSLQGRTQTMPLLIYNVLERDIDTAIWTGLILVVLALVALLIAQWLRAESPSTESML
jgi:molybdate transport system permease protein